MTEEKINDAFFDLTPPTKEKRKVLNRQMAFADALVKFSLKHKTFGERLFSETQRYRAALAEFEKATNRYFKAGITLMVKKKIDIK